MIDRLILSEDGKTVEGLKELESIEIPEGVTCIGEYAFFIRNKLSHILLPQSLIQIEARPFSGCEALKEINIPKNVSTINGNPFIGCSSLEAITVDSGNKHFESENGILYSKNMETLLSVPLRKTLESFDVSEKVIFIGEDAFLGHKKMKRVRLPKHLVSIGNGSFSRCESLEHIIIPDQVVTIEGYAFGWCWSLQDVVISKSIQCIEKDAFANCGALNTIKINAIDPRLIKVETGSFINLHYKKATLCVPTESLDLYKRHKVFGKFKNITSF